MNDSKCLFCGSGNVVSMMRTRQRGSAVVAETIKCRDCKKNFVKASVGNVKG